MKVQITDGKVFMKPTYTMYADDSVTSMLQNIQILFFNHTSVLIAKWRKNDYILRLAPNHWQYPKRHIS